MSWWHGEEEPLRRTIGDDARASLRSEHPPAWHEARLNRATRSLWRYVWVCAGILLAGGLLDVLGLL